MHDIFLSYSRSDGAFVEKLRASLGALGSDVWIDYQGISAGAIWDTRIQDALREAKLMLLILSPASTASDNVGDEWRYFRTLKKPIIPLLIEATEVNYRLSSLQYIDFQDWKNEAAYQRGLTQLYGVLTDEYGLKLNPLSTINSLTDTAIPIPTDQKPLPVKQEDNSKRYKRLLEAAMPQESLPQQPTELRVKISLPDSLGLRGELPDLARSGQLITKEDVGASAFSLKFPSVDGQLRPALVCIRIYSSDFEPRLRSASQENCGEDAYDLIVPEDDDSHTMIFEMLPSPSQAASGYARIYIDVLQNGVLIAQNAIATQIVSKPAASLPSIWGLTIASIPFAVMPLQPPQPAPAATAASDTLTMNPIPPGAAIPPAQPVPVQASPRVENAPARVPPLPPQRKKASWLGDPRLQGFVALLTIIGFLFIGYQFIISQARPLAGVVTLTPSTSDGGGIKPSPTENLPPDATSSPGPSHSPSPSPEGGAALTPPAAPVFQAEISSLQNMASVGYETLIGGSYDAALLGEQQLWVFVKPREENYLPQLPEPCAAAEPASIVVLNPAQGSWTAMIHIGQEALEDNPTNFFEVVLYAATPDTLSSFYAALDRECAGLDAGESPAFISPRNLGFEEKDRVLVVRQR